MPEHGFPLTYITPYKDRIGFCPYTRIYGLVKTSILQYLPSDTDYRVMNHVIITGHNEYQYQKIY